MRKAAFFDRDGVLNVDKGYVGHWRDFQWIPGAKEALADLTAQGYAIIVITNQSGVARGYYTEQDVRDVHQHMCADAQQTGGLITAVYYCPYLEGAAVARYDRKSDWRKPAPGMILQAVKEHDIDISQSFMIGDMPRDVECGRNAGMDGYQFRGGRLDTFIHQILQERNSRETV
ncbi:MAG: HAD family hydrolase [Megasphaera sp.]|jgi:D-glycero-D-manno-heptose 1,7-bisphosphate phosphatase|nr:HAD family hydrolase [Megasphaera sp.]MCI1248329.1 HAD family hydrolase [Megasphaera sp.]